eukprot:scaffold111_cov404-Prasinococcus_capsulatus_cf.AAC.22
MHPSARAGWLGQTRELCRSLCVSPSASGGSSASKGRPAPGSDRGANGCTPHATTKCTTRRASRATQHQVLWVVRVGRADVRDDRADVASPGRPTTVACF